MRKRVAAKGFNTTMGAYAAEHDINRIRRLEAFRIETLGRKYRESLDAKRIRSLIVLDGLLEEHKLTQKASSESEREQRLSHSCTHNGTNTMDSIERVCRENDIMASRDASREFKVEASKTTYKDS